MTDASSALNATRRSAKSVLVVPKLGSLMPRRAPGTTRLQSARRRDTRIVGKCGAGAPCRYKQVTTTSDEHGRPVLEKCEKGKGCKKGGCKPREGCLEDHPEIDLC